MEITLLQMETMYEDLQIADYNDEINLEEFYKE